MANAYFSGSCTYSAEQACSACSSGTTDGDRDGGNPLLLQAIPPKEVRWVRPATMLSRMIVDIVDGITMMNTS